MSGPRVTPGVRALLFDRLAMVQDEDLARQRARRMLDRTGLRDSIAVELDRLLNTRTAPAAKVLAGGRSGSDRGPSTVTYGLPDLSHFWPQDPTSEAQLAGVVQATILAFEPRLRRPRVTIERISGRRPTLLARIEGEIMLEGMVEPVTFPVTLRDGAEEAEDV